MNELIIRVLNLVSAFLMGANFVFAIIAAKNKRFLVMGVCIFGILVGFLSLIMS